MTIHVTIKNEDSRANAVVEVLSTDEYTPIPLEGPHALTRRHFKSEGLLRGGESKTVYVTSTMSLEVVERMNEY
jgi:hypothetical protein